MAAMTQVLSPKRWLRKFARRAGYEIHNIARAAADAEALELARWAWIHAENIGTILDIGANTGQFASKIHCIKPDAQLYCFEPIPECYEQLMATMRQVLNFRGLNLALSDFDGEEDFFRNGFSPSSSMLPMGILHKELFPTTAVEITRQRVRVARLDSVADQIVVEGEMLIKMDVQGTEDRVIRGGKTFFGRAQAVISEVAYFPLYEGQPLFGEIHQLLGELGFAFAGTIDQFYSWRNGVPVYADALFIKREKNFMLPFIRNQGN